MIREAGLPRLTLVLFGILLLGGLHPFVWFLLYFGLWRRWREKKGLTDYRILNIPMLLIAVFSFGAIFSFISHLPLPLISVERTPSRFLILPLLILFTLSCIWMQKTFDRFQPGWGIQILAVAGIAFEGIFLMEHFSAWYAHASRFELAPGLLQSMEPISDWAKSMEEYYVSVVQISYLITLTAIMVFVTGSIYFARKARGNEE